MKNKHTPVIEKAKYTSGGQQSAIVITSANGIEACIYYSDFPSERNAEAEDFARAIIEAVNTHEALQARVRELESVTRELVRAGLNFAEHNYEQNGLHYEVNDWNAKTNEQWFAYALEEAEKLTTSQEAV